MITNFTGAGINNNSVAIVGYEDFTGVTGNVSQGATYTFSITRELNFVNDQLLIWVDWNGDLDFTDVDEDVFEGPVYLAGDPGNTITITGSFTVPVDAVVGDTRMRIRYQNETPGAEPFNDTPCGNSFFGQVEDYTINICAPPSGTVALDDNCAVNPNTFELDVTVTDLGSGASADVTYTVNNGAPQTVPYTSTPTSIGPFDRDDEVSVSISTGLNCETELGTYFSNCPVEIDCGSSSPYVVTHCYGNVDQRTFTFVSSDPLNTIDISFDSGLLGPGDGVTFWDGPVGSTQIPLGPFGNDLVNLGTMTSTGTTLSISIQSNASESCADGEVAGPWEFRVRCSGCLEPQGDVEVVNVNCLTQTFDVQVDLYDLGFDEVTEDYPASAGIRWTVSPDNSFNGQMLGLTEDIHLITGIPLGNTVSVTLVHINDGPCNVPKGNFSNDPEACPPPNDDCANATVLPIVAPAACPSSALAGTTFGAGVDGANPTCAAGGTIQDVWYSVNSGAYIMPLALNFYNVTAGNLGIQLFTACGTPVAGACLAAFAGTINVTLAPNTDYLIRVFTNTNAGVPGNFNICLSGTGACGSTVYDPGGPAANYPNSGTTTVNTYCPENPGDLLTATFTSFNVEPNWDKLYVFNGPTTASPMFASANGVGSGTAPFGAGGWWGNLNANLPGPFTSTHPSGCLTFAFWADTSVNFPGYAADLTCCDGPPPTLTVGSNGPICIGDDLELTADTDIGTIFSWTGPGGFTSNDQNPIIPAASPGYAGVYTVTTSTGVLTACPMSGSVTVDINEPPVLLNVTATPPNVCLGGNSQLNALVQGPSAYCACASTNTTDEWLSNVTFAGINNNSGSTTYSDFTAFTASVNAGSSYPLSVTIGINGSYTEFARAYIDWNQNGVFDAGEFYNIGTSCNTNGCVLSTNINVPVGAINGNTRMRIAQRWNVQHDASGCGTYAFGEVEDYTVNVSGGVSNLSYSWSPGTYLSSTSVANPMAQNAMLTTEYTVTVTDGLGCETSDAVTLNVYESPSVNLEINTDLSGSQTTWEIADATTNGVLCSGGPYIDGFQINAVEVCCLPNGCYVLRVFDSAGDGMSNGFQGGYQLRFEQPDNRRIIDNRGNGDFGNVSQITGNAYSFCMPMGDDRLIYTSCDKYWWRTAEYIVCQANAAVSALYVPGAPNNQQSNNTGYEFWFFNPNGGYSFRKFRSHNITDGMGNIGATRTCHLKINNWAAASHIPEGELMNVRVRGRLQGSNLPWGPACRFVRDESLALCPPTKLMDIPGNVNLSCGQFRQFVGGQRVYARPIGGSTQYQWRLRIPAENVEIIRTTNSYILNFPWGAAVAPPLEPGKTYEVDVRAFKNGAWCVDPLDADSAWGDMCLLTILGSPAQNSNLNLGMENDGGLSIWPNPNRGDQFWLNMDAIEEGVLTVAIDIMDLTGKRVIAREIPVNDKNIHTVIDLNGDLATGMYMVSITAGDKRWTERLVIAN